jgi:hypothetical protein
MESCWIMAQKHFRKFYYQPVKRTYIEKRKRNNKIREKCIWEKQIFWRGDGGL